MNQLSKLFVTTLLSTAVLTACGGGGGSSQPPAQENIAISGKAIKGIIKNGVVKIYGVTNGVKNVTPLVEGTTDANGQYSLTVEGYNGPVVIEITAGATSKMKCDVLAGCNGTAFGQDVDLDSNFSLKAIVPSVNSSQPITTNVSALTTLAAALAEEESISETSVNSANSQVASLFNITGKLTEVATVDITDETALAGASSQAKEIAILNAALLTAALADASENSTVAGALQSIAQNFVSNSGQLKSNEASDSSEVSLSEIYEEVLAIAGSSQFADVDLGALESTTELLKSQADSATPDSLSNAQASDPVNADSSQAAKDMVAAVRTFGLASTYSNSAEKSFIDELETAVELANSADVDTVLSSLKPLSKALNAAYVGNQEAIDNDETPLTSFTYTDDNDFDIVVTISAGSGEAGDTYSIDVTKPADDDTPAIDVDIAAVFYLDQTETETETETGEDGTFDGTSNFALSGTISTADIGLTINSGTIEVSLDSEWEYNESSEPVYSEDENETINFAFDIDLDVTLAQLTGTAPVSFTGALSLAITDLTLVTTDEKGQCDISKAPEGTTSCYGYGVSGTEDISFDDLDFMLSGMFSKNSESVKATVTVSLDANKELHSQHSEWSHKGFSYYIGENEPTYAYTDNDQSEIIGETADNYVGVQFGIALDIDLAESADLTGIMFSAHRTGLESFSSSLDIKFETKRLEVAFDVDDEDVEVVVTDQNGDTLTIIDTCVENTCTITGNIMIDGVQVATLEQDEENDVTVITYLDGSFEVL